VPSEVGRLIAPLVAAGTHVGRLDEVSRKSGGQHDTDGTLIGATDEMLAEVIPGYSRIVDDMSIARSKLRDRRFSG
jgi:hypothetical protein